MRLKCTDIKRAALKGKEDISFRCHKPQSSLSKTGGGLKVSPRGIPKRYSTCWGTTQLPSMELNVSTTQ